MINLRWLFGRAPATAALALALTHPVSAATGQAPDAADAAARLAAFAAAWSTISSYRATTTVFERKADVAQTVVLDYDFAKPAKATVYMTAGPNAGTTLEWDGGPTVVGHRGSGFAALFKKTLPLHDPQVTTPRGSSIDQLSFGAILAHAQQQTGTLLATAGDPIDGEPTIAVTLVPATPADDAGFTREVLELSATTYLPKRVVAYEGDTLVRKIDFTNVTVTAR